MTAQYLLREEAADCDRNIDGLTEDIEAAEKRIVDLRRKRDTLRFHRAELLAAASALDGIGFTVTQDAGGLVTVSIDPIPSAVEAAS